MVGSGLDAVCEKGKATKRKIYTRFKSAKIMLCCMEKFKKLSIMAVVTSIQDLTLLPYGVFGSHAPNKKYFHTVGEYIVTINIAETHHNSFYRFS